jgi:hypothetical protein
MLVLATWCSSRRTNRRFTRIFAGSLSTGHRAPCRSVLRGMVVAGMGAVLGRSGSANAQAVLRGTQVHRDHHPSCRTRRYWCCASQLFDQNVDLRDEDVRREIGELVEASLARQDLMRGAKTRNSVALPH